MKILIAGDFAPKDRVATLVDEERYGEIFPQNLVDTIKGADYSVLNLEAPVVKSQKWNRIIKSGPHLKASPKAVKAVEFAGFRAVTLANNHFRDYGDEGVADTLSELQNNHIDYVGGGMSLSEASQTLFKQVGEQRLAIINCCEREFSVATETTAGSNPLSPLNQFRAIRDARSQADFVIVIVHGGHEHYKYPSLRMQDTYRYFIEAGADAVINHHQHCFSGYELYEGKPIFYGLGNFCFDWSGKRNCIWNDGYLVELELSGERNVRFRLLPYRQCDAEPNVRLLNELETSLFEQTIYELNDIISDAVRLKAELNIFYSSTSRRYLLALSPFTNKYLKVMQRKGLIPSFISLKRIIQVRNLVSCESHRDRFLSSLETEIHKQ